MLTLQPRHADGQRRFVPGFCAQLPQLLEQPAGDVGVNPESIAAQQGERRDAHRGAARVIGGQRIGHPARPLPTQTGGSDVAGGRPRSGAHVPGVRGVLITGGFQMFSDQRSILVGRRRVTFFDCGRNTPVHLGSIGLELCFIGHRTNQRVVEHILGFSR